LISVESSSDETPTIDNENDVIANVSGLAVGVYEYELEVAYFDAGGEQLSSETDIVEIVVAEVIPVISANAGDDVSIEYIDDLSIALDGSASEGDITSYTWSLIYMSPSSNSIPVIDDESAVIANISNIAVGVYEYELEVAHFDEEGEMLSNETDIVEITINEFGTELLLNVDKNQEQLNLRQIEVFDMTGIHLRTVKIDNEGTNLNGLGINAGLYILRNIYQNGSTEVKKVLISE